MEQSAGQRPAEYDDAHADQPGLDDQDGSETAVGAALDAISGENTSREKSLTTPNEMIFGLAGWLWKP